jgi:ectoine hydroxylase-related dioxygenase (phytanoyl-CoA dioxygenase family)
MAQPGARAPGLLDTQVQEVTERGYCVIPHALSTAEVAAMSAAFDHDRSMYPRCWQLRGRSRDGGETGESGRWQTEPLCRTEAFDGCICHPSTFPLLCRLMGTRTMRLVHMSAMSRDPVAESAPEGMPDNIHWQLWHREEGGRFAPDHPFCMRTCMVLYLLDDCDPGSHCFSVVPESLAAKRQLKWRMQGDKAQQEHATVDEPFTDRMWRNRPGSMLSDDIMDGVGRQDSVDVLGPAGTAIVTNASNIHAGTVRRSQRPRRSIILWWTHGPTQRPPYERWLSDPPRTQQVGGPQRALPPRLTQSAERGWLFDERPLSRADKWRTRGELEPAQPRL